MDDCAALGDEAAVEDFVVSVVLEFLRFGIPEMLDEIIEVGGQHECGVFRIVAFEILRPDDTYAVVGDDFFADFGAFDVTTRFDCEVLF